MAKYIVQHRRGTAEQWLNSEIIPRAGELVVEIDEENNLHKLKIGDGEHLYSELAYLMAGDEVISQVLAQTLPRIIKITLEVEQWEAVECETDPNITYYAQTIALDGITDHSRLDLQPDVEMLAEFEKIGLAFVTKNQNRIITVYSVGNMPLKSYTMQATIVETEIEIDDDKVIGIPVGASVSSKLNLENGSGNESIQSLDAEAIGLQSFAFGGKRYDKPDDESRTKTSSEGEQSFAAGGSCHSIGKWSVSLGRDNKSYNRASFTSGAKNIAGNEADGDIEGYQIAMGSANSAAKQGSVSIGSGNKNEKALYSFLLGYQNSELSDWGTAKNYVYGCRNVNYQNFDTANVFANTILGSYNKVAAINSTVVGYANQINGDFLVTEMNGTQYNATINPDGEYKGYKNCVLVGNNLRAFCDNQIIIGDRNHGGSDSPLIIASGGKDILEYTNDKKLKLESNSIDLNSSSSFSIKGGLSKIEGDGSKLQFFGPNQFILKTVSLASGAYGEINLAPSGFSVIGNGYKHIKAEVGKLELAGNQVSLNTYNSAGSLAGNLKVGGLSCQFSYGSGIPLLDMNVSAGGYIKSSAKNFILIKNENEFLNISQDNFDYNNGVFKITNSIVSTNRSTDDEDDGLTFVTKDYVDTNCTSINPATEVEIDAKTDNYKPIVPKTLDYAVKKGIADNSIDLTDTEQSKAQAWIGVDESVNKINAIENLLSKAIIKTNGTLIDEIQQTGGAKLEGLDIVDESLAVINKISGNTVSTETGYKNAKISGIKSFGKNIYDNAAVSCSGDRTSLSNSYGTRIDHNDASKEITITQTKWGAPNNVTSYHNGYVTYHYDTHYEKINSIIVVSFDLEILDNPLNTTKVILLNQFYNNGHYYLDGTLLNQKQRLSTTLTLRSVPTGPNMWFELYTAGMNCKISNFQICAENATDPTVFEPHVENTLLLSEPIELGKWDYIMNGKIVRQTVIEPYNEGKWDGETYDGCKDPVYLGDGISVAYKSSEKEEIPFEFDNQYIVYNKGIEQVLTPTDEEGKTCFDYGANITLNNEYVVLFGGVE